METRIQTDNTVCAAVDGVLESRSEKQKLNFKSSEIAQTSEASHSWDLTKILLSGIK